MIRDFTRRHGLAPNCTCGDERTEWMTNNLRHFPACAFQQWADRTFGPAGGRGRP